MRAEIEPSELGIDERIGRRLLDCDAADGEHIGQSETVDWSLLSNPVKDYKVSTLDNAMQEAQIRHAVH